MKVFVELNSKVDSFSLKEVHQARLIKEFPQHEFVFVDSYSELKENIQKAEAALVWVFPQHLFQKAPLLKALYTPAAGKDWVAQDSTGKVKTYYSSFHGHIISESFLAMLLMNNNKVLPAYDNFHLQNWGRNAFGRRKLLCNQSLLILGYGNIGRYCADRARILGMSVTGVKRSETEDTIPVIPFSQMMSQISNFDHVLNLLPGGDATSEIVSAEMLAAMKKGASFYNFGRGTTVDEAALIENLNSGHLSFAGLDVTAKEPPPQESPLWKAKNVFITPHSSCCYEDYLHLFIDELKEKL